jgi:hypothetical protein
VKRNVLSVVVISDNDTVIDLARTLSELATVPHVATVKFYQTLAASRPFEITASWGEVLGDTEERTPNLRTLSSTEADRV